MPNVEPFRHQTHPLRGLAYNLRRLVAPRSHISIALPAQHLRFSLPIGSIFARLLYKYGEYERGVSNWLIEHHRQLGEGLFVDVGANFGWYTCLMTALDGHRPILAFEPEPHNFELLQAQLALNGAKAVQALQKGLGAAPGHLQMYKYKEGNAGRHSLLPLHDGEQVQVEVVKLDQQLADLQLLDSPIALMKMDIEGYEIFALRGAKQALLRTRRLILEFSPQLMRQAQLEPDDLLDILAERGFTARIFDPDGGSSPRTAGFDELRALGRSDRQLDLLFESQNAPALRQG
jgi:FkbM family methyltransferase